MKTNKAMIIVISIVVLLIPIIYSFFYLKSYWDPYGNLSDMKIAVVNLDKGKDDENEGKEFIKGLKDDATFNICEVSKEESEEGLKDEKYYAVITVPENFTECLNSASTENKEIAKITYSPNQATNYLATQIINSAVKTMELNLESKINSKIIANLSDKLKDVPNSLEDISDGAGQILEGSENLSSGVEQISEGASKLSNSYIEFDNGVNSAQEGSKTLENGITQADLGVSTLSSGATSLNSAIEQINEGANELAQKGNNGIVELGKGVTKLNNGSKELSTGVATFTEGSENLARGTIGYVTGAEALVGNVNNYIDGVDNLNGNVSELLTALAAQSNSQDLTTKVLAGKAQKLLDSKAIDGITVAGSKIKAGGNKLTTNNKALTDGANGLINNADRIKAGANALASGTQELLEKSSSLTDLTNGIDKLNVALGKVQTGTESLENGVSTLKQGTEKLNAGSNNLRKGLETLSASSEQVKNGINTLDEGAARAYDGSKDLVEGVQKFKNKIDEGIQTTEENLKPLESIDDFAENPVEFDKKEYGKVESYGIAFTPLFLCIGLWVGSLMLYVVLYYDQKNRFKILGSQNKNKILQNFAYIGLGALQGIITAVLLKAGLGFEVENMGLFIFASTLIGISFVSIIQFLIRNFNDVGKFLALIILVLQLGASGGTFPIETIDKGFQACTNWLPMTYAIRFLREILVPTATNNTGKYIGILVGITIVTVTITCIVDVIRSKRKTVEEK